MAECSIRLRMLREAVKMSRDELAVKFDVARSTLQRWEDPADSAEPCIADLEKYVAVFGTTHVYLCQGIEPVYAKHAIMPKDQAELISLLKQFGITTPEKLEKILSGLKSIISCF